MVYVFTGINIVGNACNMCPVKTNDISLVIIIITVIIEIQKIKTTGLFLEDGCKQQGCISWVQRIKIMRQPFML